MKENVWNFKLAKQRKKPKSFLCRETSSWPMKGWQSDPVTRINFVISEYWMLKINGSMLFYKKKEKNLHAQIDCQLTVRAKWVIFWHSRCKTHLPYTLSKKRNNFKVFKWTWNPKMKNDLPEIKNNPRLTTCSRFTQQPGCIMNSSERLKRISPRRKCMH